MPYWNDINTKEKRESILNKYRNIAVPAGELYIGPQSVAVLEAVNKFRQLGYDVDYYIISAGFGLIRDDYPLPPYESSFSGKTIPVISSMAQELEIQEDLRQLVDGKYYDLIYLALGKDYLRAVGDLTYLQNFAKDVIHFSRREISGLVMINEQDLVGYDHTKNPNLYMSVGSSTAAKGRVLLNYAINRSLSGPASFTLWWDSVKKNVLLPSKSVNVQQRAIKPRSNINIVTQNADIDYRLNNKMVDRMADVSKPSIQRIISYVSGISNDDLTDLMTTLKGLDTVKTKKNQTRKEWVEEHEHREDIARYFVEGINNLIDELVNSNNDTKGKLKTEIITQLRAKQEVTGQTTLLINAPRLSLLSTLIRWIDEPELQDVVSEYKPRTDKKIVTKSAAPDVELEVTSWRVSDFSSEIIINLKNKSPFPLQNLEIEIKSEDEDYSLGLDKVSGNNTSIQNNKVIIDFIKASMDSDVHVEQIRIYTIGGTEEENFQFSVTQDYPGANTRTSTIFSYT